MVSDTSDHKAAAAEAKAAKAKAKALRPWFKKKRFIFLILIGVIVLISIFSSCGKGGSSKTASESSTSAAEEAPAEKVAGIGTAVVDGKFTFTVKSVKCGIASVGSDMLGAKAQGQFCQVNLTVANTGDEPQTMFASNQHVFDTDGRKFDADTTAMIYASDGSDAWMKDINPGNSLTGALLFDVPKGASLDHIELHDSAFSGGVEVSLK